MNLSEFDINADGLIASENEKADIVQCIRTLFLTPEGTVPLYREFGLNTEKIIGAPIWVAANLLAVEIMDKVAIFEPRAAVTDVQTETNPDTGQLRVKVVITNG